MTSVFIAGSRKVSKLDPQIRERLDNIMKQNFVILLGDANGADKAVQRYLAGCHYANVKIHCMEVCRNNIGGWPTHAHPANSAVRRDRHYYGIKDLAMANDASCGFMLWDGESKGTLTNVVNLLASRKGVLLYLSRKKQFFKLGTFNDFHRVLSANGITNVPRFLESMGIDGQPAENLRFAGF